MYGLLKLLFWIPKNTTPDGGIFTDTGQPSHFIITISEDRHCLYKIIMMQHSQKYMKIEFLKLNVLSNHY